MNETIRDYIKRRVRLFMAIGLLAWLALPGWFSITRDGGQPWVPFVAIAVFGSATLGMRFFVRCPKCKVRLGQIGMQVGLGFLKPTVNFCPYCGVSFDELRPNVPSSQTPTHSQNPLDPIK